MRGATWDVKNDAHENARRASPTAFGQSSTATEAVQEAVVAREADPGLCHRPSTDRDPALFTHDDLRLWTVPAKPVV